MIQYAIGSYDILHPAKLYRNHEKTAVTRKPCILHTSSVRSKPLLENEL